ncbi:tetratricopeptide repeat protein [Terricaulis sp.]|uniref:tetratricopeptide repeat protein n=1 Tax=Terricaulis sp. TaxID=2768686 RepID=UPI003783FED7
MKYQPEISALANAAKHLLDENDAVGAERVLAPVFSDLKSDPSVLHLMGLIKKAQNQMPEAERYLRAAVANTLTDGGYYNDLGVVLQARKEYGEATRIFRAAMALMPYAAQVRVNLVRCLMAAGEMTEAEQEVRAYIAAMPGPEGWTLLSQLQRQQERHDEALASAETALKFAPKLRGLRQSYANALDRVGRGREALALYERLAHEHLDSPDLALSFARGLYAANRKDEAEQVLEQGIKLYGTAVPLHAALARVRALRGEGERCTAITEAEIAKRPNDLTLRLACADALHRAHFPEKALRVLYDALLLAPDTPALLSAYGIVLDEIDRTEDGLKSLRRVVQLQPGSRTAHRNLLSTLLRSNRADEALEIVRALRREEPDEQYLIACEATALRLIGHAEYRTFCNYEQMVKAYEVPVPRGFFTTENFNASLADVLRIQHKVNAHPLDQFIHAGSQTGRSLLNLEEPNLKAFIKAIDGAVRDYIAQLDSEAPDPMSQRKRDRFRYSGLWSVRLGHEGYQPNHVHDRGWISSAYFVSVMASEKKKDPRAGQLKFGEPSRPMRGAAPEKFIEPKVGTLVLFPSYFWHGTVPFEGQERLSMAFDVIPA